MDKKHLKNGIIEHVRNNIKKVATNYSHVSFMCIYNGVKYTSATMYPKTAITLLANKIFFHTVVKPQKTSNG